MTSHLSVCGFSFFSPFVFEEWGEVGKRKKKLSSGEGKGEMINLPDEMLK